LDHRKRERDEFFELVGTSRSDYGRSEHDENLRRRNSGQDGSHTDLDEFFDRIGRAHSVTPDLGIAKKSPDEVRRTIESIRRRETKVARP
jgi:hypothetical protein